MPTYDYRCLKCGDFEHAQPITEPALKICPHCGSPAQRLISRNIGILFKGSGFYVTDNRKSNAVIAGEQPTVEAGEQKPASGIEPKTATGGEQKAAVSGEQKAASGGEQKTAPAKVNSKTGTEN